jgi:hypothetical protein
VSQGPFLVTSSSFFNTVHRGTLPLASPGKWLFKVGMYYYNWSTIGLLLVQKKTKQHYKLGPGLIYSENIYSFFLHELPSSVLSLHLPNQQTVHLPDAEDQEESLEEAASSECGTSLTAYFKLNAEYQLIMVANKGAPAQCISNGTQYNQLDVSQVKYHDFPRYFTLRQDKTARIMSLIVLILRLVAAQLLFGCIVGPQYISVLAMTPGTRRITLSPGRSDSIALT